MKKIFLFTLVLFAFLFTFKNADAQNSCPSLAPYQCNNGSCVNDPDMCNQSWGGGLAGTNPTSTTGGVSNTSVTSQTCTGDISNNVSDAQACANLAQAQAIAKGYTATCTVQTNSNPLDNAVYVPICTINGSTGHDASLLSGYTSSTGFNVNPGWTTLSTELNNLQLYGSFQPCTPTAINNYFCPGGTATQTTTKTTGITGTTGSSSPGTTAIINMIEAQIAKFRVDLFAVSQQLYKAQLENYAKNSGTVAAQETVNTILNNIEQNAPNVTPFNPGTSQGFGTVYTTPGGTFSTSTCYIFTKDLTLGSTGADVTALAKVLYGETLFGNLSATVFDTNMKTAVKAFQEKYAIQILAPLGLATGTGLVGPSTRNYLNSRCSGGNTNPPPLVGTTTMTFRFLKVSTTENGWVSWREVEFYDKSGAKISGITATASDTYDGTWQYPPIAPQIPSNVLDGNIDTTWNAGETNPNCIGTYGPACPGSSRSAYITLDLGSVKDVGKIRLMQNGNTTSETTTLNISSDGASYAVLTTFTGAMADKEWLEYPANPYANLPAPTIAGMLIKYPITTSGTTEQYNLYTLYPSMIANAPKVQNGETTIIAHANTTGSDGEIVAYLWSVANADYITIDKVISYDPSLGSIPLNYQGSLTCTQQIYDLQMFPTKLGATQNTYLLDGLSTITLFSPDTLMPNSTRSTTVRPMECNIGRVYTTTVTGHNKSGKTGQFKFVIRVQG